MIFTPVLQSDVLALAPELSSITTDGWTDILLYVNEMDLTALGESKQVDRMAKIYLAAHIATVTRLAGNGVAGPVTSVSAGGLRRSYGMYAIATGTSLGSTRYGQQYLDIIGMSAAHGPFVI